MEGRLTSLRTLAVGECPSLTTLSLTIKHLTALETLIIQDCKELSLTDKEENQDLRLSLQLLTIVELPKLEVLPQWLQASANTLQHLSGVCNREIMTSAYIYQEKMMRSSTQVTINKV
ncbi:hypothetical protein CMV_021631 [Castanea mollissima]|uniref:Uncharacterized protein n=1 Tax=Castanea mollissima TaxID=60419 RepID=A0A8J4VEW4_9ROSI|nr:hypothetical protein CMV_021631 [Castanea mollissima]